MNSELGAMIDRDRVGEADRRADALQGRDDVFPGERKSRLEYRTLTTPLIHHGQHAELPSAEQFIMHKVHTPALAVAGGYRDDTALPCHVLASPDTHPDLQPFQAIQPIHAILANAPAFATQHHVDSQIAKARPRLCNLANAQA